MGAASLEANPMDGYFDRSPLAPAQQQAANAAIPDPRPRMPERAPVSPSLDGDAPGSRELTDLAGWSATVKAHAPIVWREARTRARTADDALAVSYLVWLRLELT